MEKPWAADTDDVIRDLNSNASMGLAEEEARERGWQNMGQIN